RYLMALQKANGSWDYTGRTQGDTSISQYAVLGLWEAENGGATVPPEVWERAAGWFMSSQSAAGSWNYHRDEPGRPETLAMTGAGVGSLLICQRQLDRYRRKGDAANPLLVPVSGEGRPARYDVGLSNAKLDLAIRRGINWLAANYTTGTDAVVGDSPYYALYGVERMGALANRETLGRVDWFDQGRRFIRGSQQPDGSWNSSFGAVPNTVWAILFVTKSTAKTLARINVKSLGAGTLLGGRGLPKDLSSLTVAGGRVVSRPMNGAVEGMLAVMEDPRADQADSALSGLVARYRAEGPAVLRPLKDRFLKMRNDRDPGLRRVAAWALARTGDHDTVPALIDALTDPDESVVVVAREGLQLLSRKIEGHGPPSPSTPGQRREAAERWHAWYRTIRPLDVEGQDVDAAPSAAATSRSPR
ncbi:MAG: HEAT repeat domain-containing protein, partial [Planctomycetia bacterium]|nr:HEAT repeat domain-containing protein [Planctomycetia bacterium]